MRNLKVSHDETFVKKYFLVPEKTLKLTYGNLDFQNFPGVNPGPPYNKGRERGRGRKGGGERGGGGRGGGWGGSGGKEGRGEKEEKRDEGGVGIGGREKERTKQKGEF